METFELGMSQVSHRPDRSTVPLIQLRDVVKTYRMGDMETPQSGTIPLYIKLIWTQISIKNGTSLLEKETTFQENDEISSFLKADTQIEAFSRRLLLEGIISAHGKTIYFLGKAVDGPAELKVSPALFTPSPKNGIFISEKSPEKIVLGRGLAESLNLNIGDEASLMLSTVRGAVNGLDVVRHAIQTSFVHGSLCSTEGGRNAGTFQ